MSCMLPEDLLLTLNERIPCRDLQFRQLVYLIGSDLPGPSTIVLHGTQSTGKTLVIKSLLTATGTLAANVKSRECITPRHLLERTIIAVSSALGTRGNAQPSSLLYDSKCENMNAFVMQLQHLLKDEPKFVLVIDGIDRQREASPSLIPAIARLGEMIINLTVVLVMAYPSHRLMHASGVPHVYFPPYSRSESLAIVTRTPLSIVSSNIDNSLEDALDIRQVSDEDLSWLWSRFCCAVWDALARSGARDIVSFRAVCGRLWQPFVQPIVNGTYGIREFSKLMIRNRGLFQGEDHLTDSIAISSSSETKVKSKQNAYDLPYQSKYLLISAYLASYNPARLDQLFFTKANERKRRKRGGGTAVGKPPKPRKIQRKLLGPQAFILERLLAIFHAITPRAVINNVDVMTQIATLASLRLLVTSTALADVLDATGKWKVNLSWESIQHIAQNVRFDLQDYLAD